MAHFPTLHGKAANGKTKVWTISVSGEAMIQTVRGFLDGKMQVNEKAILVGKNIGKKNETTHLQQAISEARACWIAMKENGYYEASGEASDEPSTSDAPSRGKGINAAVPLPMLAHEFNKRGKHMVFPCYTQPKLDGVRCVHSGGLFSRLRKKIPHMEHIRAELDGISLVLDGELYTDALTFQEIVGLVKKETLKEGDVEKQRNIKYHIYDVMMDAPYEERLRVLQTLFQRRFEHLVLVPTVKCESVEKMKEQHAVHVAAGFEGIMLRSAEGTYAHSRSVELLKYKEFLDDEYTVVGFKEGEGQEKGCVLWTCETAAGQVFHCRPRGTREERMALFADGASYVGKALTVRFQELTDEGLPRFPVGIAFRDYE